jgi:hypothetical protein
MKSSKPFFTRGERPRKALCTGRGRKSVGKLATTGFMNTLNRYYCYYYFLMNKNFF